MNDRHEKAEFRDLEHRLQVIERELAVLIGEQRFTNVLLRDLLNELRPKPYPRTVAITIAPA